MDAINNFGIATWIAKLPFVLFVLNYYEAFDVCEMKTLLLEDTFSIFLV